MDIYTRISNIFTLQKLKAKIPESPVLFRTLARLVQVTPSAVKNLPALDTFKVQRGDKEFLPLSPLLQTIVPLNSF